MRVYRTAKPELETLASTLLCSLFLKTARITVSQLTLPAIVGATFAVLCINVCCSTETPPPHNGPSGFGGSALLGGQAGTSAGGTPSVVDCARDPKAEFHEPSLLSETGLYADIHTRQISPCVNEFKPRFELWSDGAEKRRFIYLPPGTQIDTQDMDYWSFPVGTKLWKEFRRARPDSAEPILVETRLIQKFRDTIDPESWFQIGFKWREDELDAESRPDGEDNVRGTQHDIPNQKTCWSCHNQRINPPADAAIGFSAIQLAYEPAIREWWSLRRLAATGRLTIPTIGPLELPGTSTQAAALGYMHANCGNCHNPRTPIRVSGLHFWLSTHHLNTVEDTSTYRTNINIPVSSQNTPPSSPRLRLVPQNPENSALLFRMKHPITSDPNNAHMPQVGTELLDEQNGIPAVEAWINSL